MGESERVFLSYRWCDAEIADRIAGCLRGAGVEVLRDVNEIDFLSLYAPGSSINIFEGVK